MKQSYSALLVDFCIKNWQTIALCCAMAWGFQYLQSQKSMHIDGLRRLQRSHDEEMTKIQSLLIEERAQRKIHIEELNAQLAKVTQDYDAAKQALEVKKQDNVKKLIISFNNDPVIMSNKLKDILNFKVVMP